MLNNYGAKRSREDDLRAGLPARGSWLSPIRQRRPDSGWPVSLAPERDLLAASRLFLKEIEAHIRARQDFGFETTLAGRSYLKLIRRLRSDGWRVELIYLALPSVALSRQLVAERVQHGGSPIGFFSK